MNMYLVFSRIHNFSWFWIETDESSDRRRKINNECRFLIVSSCFTGCFMSIKIILFINCLGCRKQNMNRLSCIRISGTLSYSENKVQVSLHIIFPKLIMIDWSVCYWTTLSKTSSDTRIRLGAANCRRSVRDTIPEFACSRVGIQFYLGPDGAILKWLQPGKPRKENCLLKKLITVSIMYLHRLNLSYRYTRRCHYQN
jgi:hypothetical protein